MPGWLIVVVVVGAVVGGPIVWIAGTALSDRSMRSAHGREFGLPCKRRRCLYDPSVTWSSEQCEYCAERVK